MVGMPDAALRARVLQIMLKDENLAPDFDYAAVARVSLNMNITVTSNLSILWQAVDACMHQFVVSKRYCATAEQTRIHLQPRSCRD